MKNEIKILSVIAIILLVGSILISGYLLNTTTPVDVDIISYEETGNNFIFSDTYNEKTCLVQYEFNGETKLDTMKVTDKHLYEKYQVRINNNGEIVNSEIFLLVFTTVAYSTIMVIASIFCNIEKYKKKKNIIQTT